VFFVVFLSLHLSLSLSLSLHPEFVVVSIGQGKIYLCSGTRIFVFLDEKGMGKQDDQETKKMTTTATSDDIKQNGTTQGREG